MSPEQLTIALLPPIATLSVVIIGFLYNNSRMSDLRGDLKDLLKAEIGRLDARIDKNHSEMLHRFADLDRRMDGLEHRMDGLERRMEGIEARLGDIETVLGMPR